MAGFASGGAVAVEPLVRLRRLDWDTEFFDALMGVVEFDEGASSHSLAELTEQLSQTVSSAREQGFRHLILRARAEDTSLAWAAESAGFKLVDLGTDLRCPLNHRFAAECFEARPWCEEDLPGLRAIASRSFVFSRFQVDPFFSDAEVAAFHETWITNLCHGLARQVLVLGEPGRPLGFVSCDVRGDMGRIPLIAVDERSRGDGAGARLVSSALSWFKAQGCQEAWVKTQAHNYPAMSLYERYGFRTARVELAFSLSLSLGPSYTNE